MNQNKRNLLIFICAIFIIWGYSIYKKNQFPEKVFISKMSLPYFECSDLLTGKKASSHSLGQNQEVVVHFFASWCAPCLQELPELLEYAKKHLKIAFILVATKDSPEAVKRLFSSILRPENIMLVLDNNLKIMNLFGSERVPESYFFASDQKLLYKIPGIWSWQ